MDPVAPPPDLDQLVVFHGDLNPHEARIYLRLDVGEMDATARLDGQIHGPLSCLTRTLPATVPLCDLGQGSGLLAGAIVPDPCFWLPGQPYLYDVSARLWLRDDVVAERSWSLGMRSCGVHAGRLFLEARPWTLWGAAEERIANGAWSDWRDASLVKLVRNPTDDCCQQASREGVMLIAELDPSPLDGAGSELGKCDVTGREARRLSRHASVAILAMGQEMLDQEDAVRHVRRTAPNLLLAQRLGAGQHAAPASWADVLICDRSRLQVLARQPDAARRAVLVQQPGGGVMSLDQAAEMCRRLGTDLSPIDGVAGWLV